MAELFDRSAPELFRVACHLAGGDPSRAEDAVQETFLTLIEAVQSGSELPQAVQPWLLGVLKNRVRRLQHREEVRRPELGRLLDEGLLDRVPTDPAEAAARRELVEAIGEQIDELPEIQRPVLRLALRHGLPPREIAHALERSPGAVRVQLSRGLAALRARIGGTAALGAALALVPSGGLEAVRARVVGVAAELRPAAAGPAAALASSLLLTAPFRFLMMKKLAVLLVAALLVGVGVVAVSSRPERADAEVVPGSDLARGELGAAEEHAAGVAPEPSGPQRSAVDAPAVPRPSSGCDLVVQVRWDDDGTPAERVPVTLLGVVANSLDRRSAGATDDEGRIVFRGLTTGEVILVTDGHHSERIECAAEPSEQHVELVAQRWARVRGVVVDEEGTPVAGARVIRSDYANGSVAHVVATTGEDGSFDVPLGEAASIGARADGYAPSSYFRIRTHAGETLDGARIPLRGTGARVSGRVVDGSGDPVAGALVVAGFGNNSETVEPSHRLVLGSRTVEQGVRPPVPEQWTGADGRYAFAGLMPGRQRVVASARGYATALVEGDARTGRPLEREIVLTPEAVLVGSVVDDAGQPIGRASVRVGSPGDPLFVAGATDDSGRFRLERLSAGGHSVVAFERGIGEASANVVLVGGETTSTQIVLARRPGLTGYVCDEDGRPIEGVGISVHDGDITHGSHSTRTDAEGRFRVDGLLDASYRMELRLPAKSALASLVSDGHRPGSGPIELTLDRSRRTSCVLAGTLLEADGRPSRSAMMYLHQGIHGHYAGFELDPETGHFTAGPVPPGSYRLTFHSEVGGHVERRVEFDGPSAQVSLGVLRFRDPGGVEVLGSSGFVELRTLRGDFVVSTRAVDGTALFPKLQPGRYVVLSHARALQEVEVQSGRTLQVTLTAPTRPAYPLRVLGAADRGGIDVRVFQDGRLVELGRAWAPAGETPTTEIRPPLQGEFEVVLEWRGYEQARRVFGADAREFEFDLSGEPPSDR